jgi:hypothetical protein
MAFAFAFLLAGRIGAASVTETILLSLTVLLTIYIAYRNRETGDSKEAASNK